MYHLDHLYLDQKSIVLVYFEILKKPRFDHNQARLKLIIDAAFNQKRKMIKSSLKKFFRM